MMSRLRFGLLVVAVALMGGSWVIGDDKKADDKDPPMTKATLPKHFTKLGLDKKQSEKILTIRGTYKAKIDDLKKQIADLEQKETKEVNAVLTDEQLAKLKELLLKG